MSQFYKLESEHGVWVNLESETHILHAHQARLQRLIARATMDLSVITEEVVARQKDSKNNELMV